MNFSTYRFTLSLHLTQSQVSLPVTLGDNARVFLITLSDGGAHYVIGDGCLAKIEIKRPTGTILQEFCPIEKNSTIIYDFSQNEGTAVVPGVHNCTITLYNANGLILGSPRFTMVVSDRVVTSDDMLNMLDDVDFTMFDSMLAKEAERQEAEEERKSAESERKEASTSLLLAAEEAKVSAEEAKGYAESAEMSAEEARESLKDTVKKTDYATTDEYGLVRLNSTEFGLTLSASGLLGVNRATEKNIAYRETVRPITPTNLDYAIKSGLTANKLTLSEDEKKAAQVWLGVDERISKLEDKHKEFVTVEGNNEIIDIPSGARQYTQILEIHGAWSLYPVYADYCSYLKNYPQCIKTDTGEVLFEMPADVEARLPDFGIRYNYLSFEDGKVFYHQGARIGEEFERDPQDGESQGEYCYDTHFTFVFDNEIVTDVTDYISFDGTIDISGAKQIIIEMKHTEDEVMAMITNPNDVNMNAFDYNVGKTKFVFEV